jgi:hypothetical protein
VLNLSFNLFEDGVPQAGRLLLFFRYETPADIVRSGILNYDVGARRFVGPIKNAELLAAAERYLVDRGLLAEAAGVSVPGALSTAAPA